MELWQFPFVWALLPVGEWDGGIGWGLGAPLESILSWKKKKENTKENLLVSS